jgi:hypothetical protein
VSGDTNLNTLLASTVTTDSIFIPASTPISTASRLYNTAGDLYWNGSLIAGAAAGTWNSNGSDVYRLTGNVGVGTSSPAGKLGVYSDESGSVTTATFSADPGGLSQTL